MNPNYDRPFGDQHQSRSVVLARNGIVATSHPLAAQTGLEVLKDGGNAVDAAVAANAMLGVVEPMSCGIGGDLFAIYWDAASGELHGLNGSGRSPYSANLEMFSRRGLTQIPDEGPLSWSVPGCVDGWEALLNRFGTRKLPQLLAPSIQTADEGFPVSEIIAGSWQEAERRLVRWPTSAQTYLPAGRAPRFGEIFRNPRLAASLRGLADGGGQSFYRGQLAEAMVAFSQSHDGLLQMRDFEDHRCDWVQPVCTSYRGYDIWELPPSGQGIAALQMLNLLESHDLGSQGPGHPDYLHLLVEAKKLAFADRAEFYADPTMAEVPVERLISKSYAQQRGLRIDPARASDYIPPGDAAAQHGDTVYLSVVDKDRNCCSLIQSIYYGFGSMVVPGDVGFALQNRGASFALDSQHRNCLAPNKCPFHTIIPAMVTQQDRPWLCFGVMGGDMQPQGHVQVLVNLIDFQMNVQQAGDAARVRHLGSATPTGVAAEGSGHVWVESGITEASINQLRRRGHQVIRAARSGFGGYQGILVDWQNGVLHGATEPRKDGAAVGY